MFTIIVSSTPIAVTGGLESSRVVRVTDKRVIELIATIVANAVLVAAGEERSLETTSVIDECC